MNPHPLGRRPFCASSFSRIPGQFWGQSLPAILKDIQRTCNSFARAMVKNAGYSAGPIGEYEIDRLENEEDIDEVRPYRMYAVNSSRVPGQSNSAAFRFTTVTNVSRDLTATFDFFSRLADDYSGIPAYVMGQPNVSGAGRTLGGLSMLLGNAAKGIKSVVSGVDKYVIEPLIERLYELEMLFGDDVTLKADCKIIARGAAGILQREMSQARSTEVLHMLTPYATGDDPIVEKDALRVVLRDVLKSLGYTADDLIKDPDQAVQMQQAFEQQSAALMQAAPGGSMMPPQMAAQVTRPSRGAPGQAISLPPGAQSTRPGTPPPKLDNRSRAPASSGDIENLPAAA